MAQVVEHEQNKNIIIADAVATGLTDGRSRPAIAPERR